MRRVADGLQGRTEVHDETVALGSLIDAEPHAAFVVGTQGRLLAWNDVAAGLFRVPKSQALGASLAAVNLDTRLPELADVVERVVRSGEPADVPKTVIIHGREHIIVAISAAPVFRPDHTLLGTVVWVDERAPETEAGAEVRGRRGEDGLDVMLRTVVAELDACVAALERTRAANQEKTQALALLNHELRAPLQVILCTLPRLRVRAKDDEILRDACAVVERQARYQSRLLDDVLNAPGRERRSDRGASRFDAAVGHALELTEELRRSRRHAVAVSIAFDPLWVRADPVHLTQIVTNLLTNAAKFTDPGGRITVDLRREAATAVLTVTDTGIGISPEVLPDIFDPFVRADGVTRSPGSCGLGLSIVRRLVAQSGGTITAWSAGRGCGAEFSVRFPLTPVVEESRDDRIHP